MTGHLQKWNAIRAVLLHLLVPAGSCVGGWVTPGVVVEGVEVAALVIGTTVHVRSHFEAIALHIRSRITNRDGAVAPATDVLPHVTSDGLDVWCAVGVVIGVDDFVSREEQQSVGILCERVDCGEETLEVYIVV